MNRPTPFNPENPPRLPFVPISSSNLPFVRHDDLEEPSKPNFGPQFLRADLDNEPDPAPLQPPITRQEASPDETGANILAQPEPLERRIGAVAAADAQPKEPILGDLTIPLFLKPGEKPKIPETASEAARRKTITRVLDATVGNQLRLLALAKMVADPTRQWVGSDMDAELNRLQGDNPGWKLGRANEGDASDIMSRYGIKFMHDKNLARLTPGRNVICMQGSEEQAETTYATTGTLLTWQDENPNTPLQKILVLCIEWPLSAIWGIAACGWRSLKKY